MSQAKKWLAVPNNEKRAQAELEKPGGPPPDFQELLGCAEREVQDEAAVARGEGGRGGEPGFGRVRGRGGVGGGVNASAHLEWAWLGNLSGDC